MANHSDWKQVDAEFAKDFSARLEESTPEPLFESVHLPTPKVCLRCGRERATSLLYSPFDMRPVLPLCLACALEWNTKGYRILKGLNAKTLLWRLGMYKLRHPLARPSILEIREDIKNLLRWTNKMKKLKEST